MSEPTSPTKKFTLDSSPLLPTSYLIDTLRSDYDTDTSEIENLELLPIECDVSYTTADSSETPDFLPQIVTDTEEVQFMSSETPYSSDSEDSEPGSPTKLRFSPTKQLLAPPQATPQSFSKKVEKTPTHPARSSMMPLFDTAPLFSKRPVPNLPAPSRIPKLLESSTNYPGVPGIRMPGDMHLSYAPQETNSNVLPRLDLLLDVAPKCTAYLSSPYPRLTKYANHSTRFYEQKVAEKFYVSPAPAPPKVSIRSVVLFAETPKKTNPPATCASTGVGKREAQRKSTIPISPKLATAARNRKCQCCAGGVHGHSHRRPAAAKTTIGKKQGTARRRPDSPPGPSRYAKPPSTVSKSSLRGPAAHRTTRSAATPAKFGSASNAFGVHQTMQTPRSTAKDGTMAAKKSATTTKKPKLNLTTSLPEFKQPLAAIAPTPEPTRAEIHGRMHTPLPVIPKAPLFSNSKNTHLLATDTPSLSMAGSSAKAGAVHTPIKMPSLDEALGPNYHMVHNFNETHPITGPLNERDLLR